MELFTGINATRQYLDKARSEGKSVGFVPTMGALHEGHLSLIRRSNAENEVTVCSIFVNPIQFNNPRDLERYPRNLSADMEMLAREGCSLVFAPGVEEMYPGGETGSIDVDFGYLENILEGKFRPGHFKGVAIVVKRLFDVTGPCKAYFGKKDYQQLMVVSMMVDKLGLPVEIVPCPIVRETDGLAMSSRNMRLSAEERKIAPLIYQAITEVKENAGSLPAEELSARAVKKIGENPAFRVEYIEIADKRTLLPLSGADGVENAIVLAAVWLNEVRLIDNVEVADPV